MATKTIVTKLHDTKITFTDSPTIDGVPVPPTDFSGCSLSFLLKDATQTPPISIKQAAIINPDGTFSYDPVATDVDSVGKFQQEWEVLYPTGKILTFPNNGYNIVKIIADLG
jgi:hypothetical protein